MPPQIFLLVPKIVSFPPPPPLLLSLPSPASSPSAGCAERAPRRSEHRWLRGWPGEKQPPLGAFVPVRLGGSLQPRSSPAALPARGNFPLHPPQDTRAHAAGAGPAAVSGVKRRQAQDEDAGELGSLPASAPALAAGALLEPCPRRASVSPRSDHSRGVFAPRGVAFGEGKQ